MSKTPLDPARLTAKDLAALLSKASGASIDAAGIERDVAAGAPSNPDGTINLVHYGAWLARETSGVGGHGG